MPLPLPLPMSSQEIHGLKYIKTTFDMLNTVHTSTDGGLTNELCIYQQYIILVSIGKEPSLQKKIIELQRAEKYENPDSLNDIEDRIKNLFTFLTDYIEENITVVKFNKNNSQEHIEYFIKLCIAAYERHIIIHKRHTQNGPPITTPSKRR
jgi:hypothetical protein